MQFFSSSAKKPHKAKVEHPAPRQSFEQGFDNYVRYILDRQIYHQHQ
jgi:hypothetical protein